MTDSLHPGFPCFILNIQLHVRNVTELFSPFKNFSDLSLTQMDNFSYTLKEESFAISRFLAQFAKVCCTSESQEI